MLDDSKLLVPAMEEVITDARPPSSARVDHVEKTPWMYADDAKPVPKSHEKSVHVRMVERIIYDDYDMPVTTTPVLQHRYYDAKQKRWSPDISANEIRPDAYLASRRDDGIIPGLKDRFGKVIAAYLNVLVREGRDIPIQFLADRVYPQVLSAFIASEIHTINALAATEDAELPKLRTIIEKARLKNMPERVKEFRDRARAKLVELGATGPEAPAQPKRKAA